MYKALCAAALLVATFALTSGSRRADASASNLTSPAIVARGKLANQTAAIPTTAIFTPAGTGLYRLSVYMTQTVSTSNANGWYFRLNWTDDAGAEQGWNAYFLTTNLTPPQAYGTFSSGIPGCVMVFQSQAGIPITYSVAENGLGDAGTYSLYYTLERLE